MIKFNNFYFTYPNDISIYKDLNLELNSGKIYGLFGKNGAGKSTLLKNILGLNRPTQGEVLVYNNIPIKRTPAFLSDIFFIPEEVYLPPIKQVSFIKIYGSFYPNFSFDQLCDNLNRLKVPATRKLNKLSFGQRKNFIIGFALACNTKIVIMDEPTNSLDIPSKSLFRELIRSKINKDKLFIISTHQVKDLENILDHILIINEGELTLNANINEISEKIAFKFYNSRSNSKNIILEEEVTGGYAVMETNTKNEKTNINLEQLFTASILKHEQIASIFSKT
ncbi:ATP-binding cassette domain-containing protein [Gillisia sp. Hel_I_29]|uniref:ABC transporter ATP-binding protein n=1 Tax=Gillisia sp. Hel_I_29 TaxID=1249975 RepID=UPI0005564D77|nr:ABC transporter ATP-binding protein [Gillisia sp. Hel_I_29]